MKNPISYSSPPKYLIEYFNGPAGPPPTCTIRRRTRQPSDLRHPDLTVGGHFLPPTCRPLVSGESGFPLRTRDACQPPGLFGAPLPNTTRQQKRCGEPAYHYSKPPSSMSSLRHLDVVPVAHPAPCDPPRTPATLFTRHRVLPPWPTPQQPRHLRTRAPP